jgi:hypothetical protein
MELYNNCTTEQQLVELIYMEQQLSSITVSPSTTTEYTVVYTLNGCPSAQGKGTVTVKPIPT